MFGVTTSDDYKPVAWMGRYPVDVTTILVVVHAAMMIVACVLIGVHAGLWIDALEFDSAQVLRAGHVWQLATYAFVHSPSTAIWFAIHLYMLFFFGREVERFIGRHSFIVLYLVLLLAPTLLLTLWGLRGRIIYADSAALHFGIFIAFATIYPDVELIFRIRAKWMAIVFGGAYSLQLLAANAWPQMAVLWISVFAAIFYVRLQGVGPELLWWDNLKTRLQPKPKFHIVQKQTARRVVEPDDVYASVDPILDKIAQSGIGSLTAGERRALDRARNRLLKKPD